MFSTLLATALRAGGVLLVGYGAPPGRGAARQITPAVAAALAAHGFVAVTEHADPAGSAVSGRRP